MWKCPTCETLNNEDVCVICGEPKPTAEEIAQMEREEKKRAYTPSFMTEKSAHDTPAPYKEIVTGEGLKKWTKYIVVAAVIILAIWGIVALYNNVLYNPEGAVDDFERYVDMNSSSMSEAFPEPIQRLNSDYPSALYEMKNFTEMRSNPYGYSSSKITQYDLEVVSETKCKGQEFYVAESTLNTNIRRLYERYSSIWSEYIEIDGASKLYIKKDVTKEDSYGNTTTDTDYFEIYAYKINGEWYLDYSSDLFY